MSDQPVATPLAEQVEMAREHYERISLEAMESHSLIHAGLDALLRIAALKAKNEIQRTALAIATRALERGRIWGGMGWTYMPMRPDDRQTTLKRINETLDAAREE